MVAVELIRARDLAKTGQARQIREACGLSLSEVGAEVGVTPTTVSRWELGQRAPRGEAAVRYGRLMQRLHRRMRRSV